MKIMTVVGTRPEIIRLSCVIEKLESSLEHVLVHTGQNYDPNLNDVFFSELGISQPDYYLAVDTSTLGRVLGDTLAKVEEVLRQERPDAVLILGDTNSAISALIAKRMGVPVFHMEAGNRSFDANVPEEINRRMVDHLSDYNLAYTEHARSNLLREGLSPRHTFVTGSPMAEVIQRYRDRVDGSGVLERLSLVSGEYFLVSAHREENVDNPERLEQLVASLRGLHEKWGYPVVVSTHPRTRKRLEEFGIGIDIDGLRFMEPFGFIEYIRLQQDSACVLSDSGTISEESAILGFAAVTIRDSMERPEALDAGSIIMCGLEAKDVLLAVELAMEDRDLAGCTIPHEYQIIDTSRRVLKLLVSLTPRHKTWTGLRAKLVN